MDPVLQLCLTVFFARICDVTFGSIRTILLVDGKRVKAALFGFVEVCIWFAVVREALNNPYGNSIFVVIAYAGGFALGNLLGGFLSEKLLGEMLSVNIVTGKPGDVVAKKLREAGFAVTEMNCRGRENTARSLLFIEIQSKRLKKLQAIATAEDPTAFITVSKTKVVVNGFLK